MTVADGLVHIWRHDFHNRHDDFGNLGQLKLLQRNITHLRLSQSFCYCFFFFLILFSYSSVIILINLSIQFISRGSKHVTSDSNITFHFIYYRSHTAIGWAQQASGAVAVYCMYGRGHQHGVHAMWSYRMLLYVRTRPDQVPSLPLRHRGYHAYLPALNEVMWHPYWDGWNHQI